MTILTLSARKSVLIMCTIAMPPHSKIGIRLNSTVAPYVKRVYQKLSSKDLNYLVRMFQGNI